MGYYMGDFYRGASRGDPGFWSGLLGIGKKLVGGIPVVGPAVSAALDILPGGSKVVRPALPAAAGAVTGAASSMVSAAKTAIMKHPVLSAAGAAGAMGTMVGAGAMALRGGGGKHVLKHCGTTLKSGRPGKCHRSMNVCNPRALRRAIRRTRGFAKLAMRTIHIVHPKKKGRFGGFKKKRRS